VHRNGLDLYKRDFMFANCKITCTKMQALFHMSKIHDLAKNEVVFDLQYHCVSFPIQKDASNTQDL
jgi:hypothetical protein